MKACVECGEEKPLEQFGKLASAKDGLQRKCRDCRNPEQRAYNQRRLDEDPDYWRKRELMKNYGMTIAEFYARLSRQGNACAICRCKFLDSRQMQVDHCHDTDVVRDILCVNCNTALGKFRDDPKLIRRAAEYLERHRA